MKSFAKPKQPEPIAAKPEEQPLWLTDGRDRLKGVRRTLAEQLAMMVAGRVALETTAQALLADEPAQSRDLGVGAGVR